MKLAVVFCLVVAAQAVAKNFHRVAKKEASNSTVGLSGFVDVSTEKPTFQLKKVGGVSVYPCWFLSALEALRRMGWAGKMLNGVTRSEDKKKYKITGGQAVDYTTQKGSVKDQGSIPQWQAILQDQFSKIQSTMIVGRNMNFQGMIPSAGTGGGAGAGLDKQKGLFEQVLSLNGGSAGVTAAEVTTNAKAVRDFLCGNIGYELKGQGNGGTVFTMTRDRHEVTIVKITNDDGCTVHARNQNWDKSYVQYQEKYTCTSSECSKGSKQIDRAKKFTFSW